MDLYFVMTVLKEKGSKGNAWICACSEACLSKEEAMRMVQKYREGWDCLAAWVQLFENGETEKQRIIYSECRLDEFGKWEEALKVTHKEAQKIYSAYANGIEYPFGAVDKNGYRVLTDTKGAEYHAGLLDEAIKKQIPKEVQLRNAFHMILPTHAVCPSCGNDLSVVGLGASKYCHYCGQKLQWNHAVESEDGVNILVVFKEGQEPKQNHPWNGITNINIRQMSDDPAFTYLELKDKYGGVHRFDIADIKQLNIERDDADAEDASE